MANEITDKQSVNQTDMPHFSRRPNYISPQVEIATSTQALRNLTRSENQRKTEHYLSLSGAARRESKTSQFALLYPNCTVGPDRKAERFSGLVCVAILASEPLRLKQIRDLLKRSGYCYLLFNNLDNTGLYAWLQAETIPTNAEEFQAYFDTAIANLLQLGLTKGELSSANSNPTTTCWEGYDEDVWSDSFPTKKVQVPPQSLLEQKQTSPESSSSNSTNNSVLNGIKHARLRAEEDQQLYQNSPKELPIDGPPRPFAVSDFPVDIYPEPFRRVIEQTAYHMNYKPDWTGSAMLYAISVAIGNSVGVRYKSYEQKAVLYLAIVGLPGANKSGPLEFVLKPLRQRNSDLYKIYKEALGRYDQWNSLPKKERDGLPTVEQPKYKTLLVSDITPEALAKTLQENLLGMGLAIDELAGWFQNFNRYNAGSEQEFWLAVWSFAPVSVTRKSSPPILIDKPLISVAGTIQPGVLNELSKSGRNQNGFIDRILFAYPDSQKKEYDSDSVLDESITEDYCKRIDKLIRLREQVKVDENGNPETSWLAFAPDAFNAMRAWRNKNTDLVNETDNPSLKGIYTKLDVYCIRLALIVEVMDYACDCSELNRIRLTSVERAIRLTEYFRSNAKKVYHELNEQTHVNQIPTDQQRLFNALPDEVETGEAITTGTNLVPPVSESTVKRLLKNQKLFKRVGYGEYAKLC